MPVLAGIALFLYGMKIMSGSLEKLAGAKLEKTLEKMTKNRLKGVALGAAVTAVIQSSSATTVMIVGFVNAGIMKLTQAIPAIMGANIGTTVTAQILRLGDVSGVGFLLTLIKPNNLAPILLIIGTMMVVFGSGKKTKDIGSLIAGLGMLFFGMSTMEQTLTPLRDLPQFQQAMAAVSNPLLGVALGAVLTAVLQSSSASIGILQALSATGAITFATAAPIILGTNIGTCIPVIMASIGANKNAKRAATVHLYFNVIGSIIFLIGIYAIQYTVGFSFWGDAMTRGSIADFHILFNVVNTIILLPFTNQLAKLAKRTVRDKKGERSREDENLLEDRFLATPGLALEQCRKVIVDMGETAFANFYRSCNLVQKFDNKEFKHLNDEENFLDKSESLLGNYLVRITSGNLNDHDSKTASEYLHAIGDFERIGDYSVNIAEVGEYNHENGITLSESAQRELETINNAVREILSMTVMAFENNDAALAAQVEPLEEVIDVMKETLKNKHVERLQAGICNVQSGISFIEVLTNLERISDHCSNIAVNVIKMVERSTKFDPHEHLRKVHEGVSGEYKEKFDEYTEKYLIPLEKIH
nr:Na/Pi symporter [Feifania hominis]